MKKVIIIILFTVVLITIITSRIKSHNDETINISRNQWGLDNNGQIIKGNKGIKGIDINIEKAWKITKGKLDVMVAVVDTGVDTSCNGLKNSIYANGLKSFDFYNNDNSIYDEYIQDYHGTYIANTIAGYDTNNHIYGVAPNISILPVKFLRGTQGNSSDAVKAIEYACKEGAKVINCSWNFNEYNKELYNIIASYPNILFVCAAGNSNINLDKEYIYPSSYNLNNIITVLAVDNKGTRYNCSGYGMNVDVGAPGVDIISVFPENDITYISGTSVASAYVSGVAALMLSVNSSITPNEIIEIMINTSRKIDDLNGICFSGGIIDAYKSVKRAKEIN